MKFKVGDKVKLKEGLKNGEWYGNANFIDRMRFTINSTVSRILDNGNIELNTCIFCYSPEMLELDSLTLSEITERNYQATVKRGLITPKTTYWDFISKIKEEYKELLQSQEMYLETSHEDVFDEKELADIILVCLAMARHFDIDILKVMEEKTIFNEQRKD